MNRKKKEENTRGSPFPSRTLTPEEFHELARNHEENPTKLHVPKFMEKDLDAFKEKLKKKPE